MSESGPSSTPPPDPPRDRPQERSGGGTWRLFRDYFSLLASRYLGMLIGAIRGFIIPGLLSPAAYGTYKTFLLIPAYARGGHLGAVSGLSRQIPFHRGQKDEERLHVAVQVAYTFSLGSALFACAILGVYSLFLSDSAIRTALLVFLVFVVTEQQIAFRDTYLVGFERFGAAARLRLLQNVLGTGLAVTGAWLGGLFGLIAATACSGMISLTIYRRVSGLGFPGFKFDRSVAGELISIGAPMLVTGLLFNVFFTVDRIVIVKWMGAEAMGFYALAVTLVGYINDLSTLLSRVIFPRMVHRLGSGESMEKLQSYVHRPMAGTSFLFPLVIVIVHYFAESLFRLVFPKYLPGAHALEILTFSILAYTHSAMYMNLVVAMKRQLGMLWIYPVATVVTLATALWAVKAGWGIEGVAGATVAGFVVFSLGQCIYAERKLLKSGRLVIRILRSYAPTAFVGLLILLEHMALKGRPDTFGWDVIRAGLVALFYLPVPILAFRYDPEFRGLFRALRRTTVEF